MLNLHKISRNYRAGRILVGSSGFLTPIIAAAVEAKTSISVGEHRLMHKVLTEVQEVSLWIYLVLIIAFIAGAFLTRKGEATVWKTIQVQLDTLQKFAFPEHQSDINDNHRVTLFKYKKTSWSIVFNPLVMINFRRWPWTGWLIPVVRSGHTGKETKAKFWAPDSGQKAQGVAGRCWSSDTSIFEERLPGIQSASSSTNKKRYSRRTNMEIRMVNEYCNLGRPLARSILAFPIRNGKGDRWGVLVFDSMDPIGVDSSKAEEAFRVLIESVGVLLEAV